MAVWRSIYCESSYKSEEKGDTGLLIQAHSQGGRLSSDMV